MVIGNCEYDWIWARIEPPNHEQQPPYSKTGSYLITRDDANNKYALTLRNKYDPLEKKTGKHILRVIPKTMRISSYALCLDSSAEFIPTKERTDLGPKDIIG